MILRSSVFSGVIHLMYGPMASQEYGNIPKKGRPIDWCAGRGFNFCRKRRILPFATAPRWSLEGSKTPKE